MRNPEQFERRLREEAALAAKKTTSALIQTVIDDAMDQHLRSIHPIAVIGLPRAVVEAARAELNRRIPPTEAW